LISYKEQEEEKVNIFGLITWSNDKCENPHWQKVVSSCPIINISIYILIYIYLIRLFTDNIKK